MTIMTFQSIFEDFPVKLTKCLLDMTVMHHWKVETVLYDTIAALLSSAILLQQ